VIVETGVVPARFRVSQHEQLAHADRIAHPGDAPGAYAVGVRWLVGDVQGCARELDDLLKRIRFDPGRDELWCLGDLVNRGPDSLAALRLWRDAGGRSLLGNHDVYALLVRSRRRPRRADQLEALFRAPDCDELLARLRAEPVLVHLPAGEAGAAVWIVHAGLDPRWHDLHEVARRLAASPHDDDWLESDEVSFATRVRCCTPDGRCSRHNGPPGECPAPYRPWDELYRGDTLVVHGHWARRGFYRGERTMGLDSACAYGGALTGWCQEEDRLVQVPARRT
jgi:bis(5'-nucleosyl)-tetraphosphatase (symmetrical)